MLVSRKFTGAIAVISAALLLCSCTSDPQKAKAKYLTAGQKYMQKGQYGDAAIEFRNAIRLDPHSADAYFQLSSAEMGLRDWQGAYRSLVKTIELDPKRVDARLERGRLYLSAGQFAKADDEAKGILQLDPHNASAYQLQGAALAGLQKPEESFAALSQVVQMSPNDSNAYLNLALAEMTLRRFKEAEEHIKKAVALDPKSLKAQVDLVSFYRLQKRIPEAETAVQAAILNNPSAPQLYLEWASMLSEAGKSAEVEAALDKLRNQNQKSAETAIALGDFYLRENNAEKAIGDYSRGLSQSPGNIEIEKRLQEVYLNTNRTAEAEKMDASLMAKAPKDPIVGVLHGRLLMAQGKIPEATVALQGTVKNAPNFAQAHYYLASSYAKSDNLGQARSELLEARKLSPGMPMALRSLVQLSLLQGNVPEAQLYAQELVQKNPVDANDRLELGSIYLRQGMQRQAEEQFQAANKLAPNLATVHLNLAMLSIQEKKWAEAEKEFETAMRLEPSNPVLVSAYADLMVARQQTPKALVVAKKFVDANPNDARGHAMLGALEFDAKNTNAAQAEFERAIQIDPKYVQVYLRLGGIYQENNQSDSAMEQYQKALDLRPKSASMITFVGNLYLQKNDLETARKYYARALEADPNFAPANANMAWVDAQEGKNLDVALGLAQKAKSTMPEVPSITDVLGWVMYKRGNYSGAVPLFEECVKKNPDSAQYRYHLGMALIGNGKSEPGKAQLQAALRIDKLSPAEKEQAQQALAQQN